MQIAQQSMSLEANDGNICELVIHDQAFHKTPWCPYYCWQMWWQPIEQAPSLQERRERVLPH
jgi:hypothetical protein